ncbi:MAG: hypothetical protein HY243_18095 [Proteobacteria bacterium]|nr:hypothetical protein [Pseudomonadota bacterium]
MKRILAPSFLMSMFMAMQPAGASAQTAAVDQSGSYTYTVVRQHGDVSHVNTRQVNERRYDRISERLATRVARIGERGWPGSRACRTSGLANDVSLDQTGSGNLASVMQSGSNDSATVTQQGDSNISYTIQRGSNETASTAQNGDHNIAFIVQRCH